MFSIKNYLNRGYRDECNFKRGIAYTAYIVYIVFFGTMKEGITTRETLSSVGNIDMIIEIVFSFTHNGITYNAFHVLLTEIYIIVSEQVEKFIKEIIHYTTCTNITYCYKQVCDKSMLFLFRDI